MPQTIPAPALEIRGLDKTYPGFALHGVDLTVPAGSIVGLIGENGAGKSTTLGAVTGAVHPDAGAIRLYGRRQESWTPEDRALLGVVLDSGGYPQTLTPARLGRVLADLYPGWQPDRYADRLARLGLPADKAIKTFSKGMQAKLSLAAAMCHGARLLVMDEPTSGLDPVVRDDILDLLLEFVQDERNAVLISSHITGDLEKVADSIAFLHEGKLVFQKDAGELHDRYGLLQCGQDQFSALNKKDILAWRRLDYAWQVLVPDRESAARKYKNAVVDPATLDDILLLYVKGELQ
ncbi:MAG: ABC transporter ATP-binding protein [Gemmiger sp.]